MPLPPLHLTPAQRRAEPVNKFKLRVGGGGVPKGSEGYRWAGGGV